METEGFNWVRDGKKPLIDIEADQRNELMEKKYIVKCGDTRFAPDSSVTFLALRFCDILSPSPSFVASLLTRCPIGSPSPVRWSGFIYKFLSTTDNI